jgi:hypothetical protein
MGSRIARADLKLQQETVIAECGVCWSLASLNEKELAVLKADGIWAVPLNGNEMRRVYQSREVAEIMGRIASDDSSLMVAINRAQAGCAFQLATLHIPSGEPQLQPPPLSCLTEGDLGALVRPSAIRHGLYLQSSVVGPNPIRLLQSDIPETAGAPPPPNRPLLKWLQGPQTRLSRFSPVWLGDDAVAYLQR